MHIFYSRISKISFKSLLNLNYYIFSKFTESQFEILNSLSKGNLRMLNKLMFNIFELYEYFDANQPTIIGGNTMVTKIIEMAAIKSELIDA